MEADNPFFCIQPQPLDWNEDTHKIHDGLIHQFEIEISMTARSRGNGWLVDSDDIVLQS